MYASVSVIVPCYRCADSIQSAIDSVSSQTMLPKEIILIDDFSDDNGETIAALNNAKSKVQNIDVKIIQLAVNCGPGSARNAGWEVATQDYLAFLDADDSWHPKKLELQFKWMLEHSDTILTGHLSVVKKAVSKLPSMPKKLLSHQVSKNQLLLKNYFPTRTVMLKRDIVNRFYPGKRYAEDYFLWLSIVSSGQAAATLNVPMAYSHKEEFGDGGLTGDLWKIQQGVFDTYHRLYSDGHLTYVVYILVCAFSVIKFCYRSMIVEWRKQSVC